MKILGYSAQKPADPEEELRWMAQEVRGYCEAVLNSLAANVPKVFLYLSKSIIIVCDPTYVYLSFPFCCIV